MRLASRIFLGLGVASLLGGGLFFIRVIASEPNLAYVILLPAVIASALFGTVFFLILALAFYLFRKR